MLKKGSELSTEIQNFALRAFVNRYTKDHKPAWANQSWKNGQSYPVQFASDRDWLEHTLFRVTRNGSLDMRSHYCHSTPTWPDHPELRKLAA